MYVYICIYIYIYIKLNIQKTKIMASGPITSREIDGQTVEAVSDFIFSGSKITADGDCSHEIKRHLLLGRKVMTNLDSINVWQKPLQYCKVISLQLIKKKKQRHYYANKGSSSQGYGFFQWSCMDVTVGLWRKLSAEELMLLNCGVGEDSCEPLELQGDPNSPF